MLHYRVIRAVSHGYPLAMFWMYVGMLLLALSLMFVFPPGTILLLWLGLGSLGFVVIGGKVLSFLEHRIARRLLGDGVCPGCARRMQSIRDESRAWQCEWCVRTFEPDGAILDVNLRSPEADAA